jgi:hypothetical protein
MLHVTFDKSIGGIRFAQTLTAPSVYLDHCGLRKISADTSLCERMLNGIKSRNGSLCVSLLNQAEFSGVTDQQQAIDAEVLVHRAYPNLFFIELDPEVVGRREKEFRAGGGHGDASQACADNLPLSVLDSRISLDTGVVERPTSGLFISAARWPKHVLEARLAAKRNDVQGMEAFRDSMNASDDQRKEYSRRMCELGKVGFKGRLSTYILKVQLMLSLIAKTKQIQPNGVDDLLHSCAPCSYCDLVVLDKEWCDLVHRARQFFSRNKVRHSLALTFPASEKGIKQFLTALESFPPSYFPSATVHAQVNRQP